MEAVNTKELVDKDIFPNELVLKRVLGRSYKAYCSLLEHFDNNEMIYTWKYYHDGKAWLCKVQYKKRTIVWMSAWKGYMKATIYIPEKYISDLYKLVLNEETIKKIRKTKNVGKSKPCIFNICRKKDIKQFDIIMQFKKQNK